ncbi:MULTISPECIES: hypothetical protein [unclassified Enterococcus]|jgi:hypothetical protein|uniref:hypothetical protein n=1 Tax=unclassified Enterococcus TaxID=2608891 RepID=UPI003D26FBC4
MTDSLETRLAILETKLKNLEKNMSSRGIYVDDFIEYAKEKKLIHPIVSGIKLAVKEAKEKKINNIYFASSQYILEETLIVQGGISFIACNPYSVRFTPKPWKFYDDGSLKEQGFFGSSLIRITRGTQHNKGLTIDGFMIVMKGYGEAQPVPVDGIVLEDIYDQCIIKNLEVRHVSASSKGVVFQRSEKDNTLPIDPRPAVLQTIILENVFATRAQRVKKRIGSGVQDDQELRTKITDYLISNKEKIQSILDKSDPIILPNREESFELMYQRTLNTLAPREENNGLFYFERVQETTLIGCKAFASSSPENPTQEYNYNDPTKPLNLYYGRSFEFVDCRGITMVGCSSVAGDEGIAWRAKTRGAFGLTIVGHTDERVTKSLVTAAEPINDNKYQGINRLTVLPIRVESSMSEFHINNVTNSLICNMTQTIKLTDSSRNQIMSTIPDMGNNHIVQF